MTAVERSEDVSRTKAYCFLIFSNLFYTLIPFYFLIISSFTITKCPGNHFLPFWLAGVAVLIIIDRVLFWKILSNEVKFEKTFPRPADGNSDQMKAWEKDRSKSSSRILILLKTNLRIVFFLSLIFGLIWSHELLFKDENLCKPVVVFSIFGFTFIALSCYLVSFIGTFFIYCVSVLSKMDRLAKASLNKVL